MNKKKLLRNVYHRTLDELSQECELLFDLVYALAGATC